MTVESKQPSRLIDQSYEQNFRDLEQVGKNGKAVGYLSLATLKYTCKLDIDQVKTYMEQRGLQTLITNPSRFEQFVVRVAAVLPNTRIDLPYRLDQAKLLYVYDRQMLESQIDNFQDLLKKYRWPTESEKVLQKLSTNTVEITHPLRKFIDAIFGSNMHKTNG